MMTAIAYNGSATPKRKRDADTTALDAALLRAVLSRLHHRAARGHVLQSWQEVADAVGAATEDSGGLRTAVACRRRYAKLLAEATSGSGAGSSVELQELLATALVEDTQWKIETGTGDRDSVARRTRLAMSGVKQEHVKAEAMKAEKSSCGDPMETQLHLVVAQLQAMEAKWLQYVAAEHVERGGEVKALKEMVLSTLCDGQMKLADLEKKQKEFQEKKRTEMSDLKDDYAKREEAMEEFKHAALAAIQVSYQKLTEQNAEMLKTALVPIAETSERLKQDLKAAQVEVERAHGELVDVRQALVRLDFEQKKERDERMHHVASVRRSNEWVMGMMKTEFKKLKKAQKLQQDAWEKSKGSIELQCASQQNAVVESMRRELQRRDALLLSMQTALHNYALRERHKETERANEKLKQSEHRVGFHSRLQSIEHELHRLITHVASSNVMLMEEKQAHNDAVKDEFLQALEAERCERKSESTKLLRTIRRILTTTGDDDTESE